MGNKEIQEAVLHLLDKMLEDGLGTNLELLELLVDFFHAHLRSSWLAWSFTASSFGTIAASSFSFGQCYIWGEVWKVRRDCFYSLLDISKRTNRSVLEYSEAVALEYDFKNNHQRMKKPQEDFWLISVWCQNKARYVLMWQGHCMKHSLYVVHTDRLCRKKCAYLMCGLVRYLPKLNEEQNL